MERMIIFNEKGIEMDETDIFHLKNNQLLFVSLDGCGFTYLNYMNQYQIIQNVKCGGYGKIYLGKNIITGELVAIKKIDTSSLCKCY